MTHANKRFAARLLTVTGTCDLDDGILSIAFTDPDGRTYTLHMPKYCDAPELRSVVTLAFGPDIERDWVESYEGPGALHRDEALAALAAVEKERDAATLHGVKLAFSTLHEALAAGGYSAGRIVERLREVGVACTVSDLHGHGLQAVANAIAEAGAMTTIEGVLLDAGIPTPDPVEGVRALVADRDRERDAADVAEMERDRARETIEQMREMLWAFRHGFGKVYSCPKCGVWLSQECLESCELRAALGGGK